MNWVQIAGLALLGVLVYALGLGFFMARLEFDPRFHSSRCDWKQGRGECDCMDLMGPTAWPWLAMAWPLFVLVVVAWVTTLSPIYRWLLVPTGKGIAGAFSIGRGLGRR